MSCSAYLSFLRFFNHHPLLGQDSEMLPIVAYPPFTQRFIRSVPMRTRPGMIPPAV